MKPLATFLTMLCLNGFGLAQTAPALGDLGAIVKPTEPVEAAVPDVIPLPEVPDRAQQAEQEVDSIQAELETAMLEQNITALLGKLAESVKVKEQETGLLLSGNPTLDELQSTESAWTAIRKALGGWQADLTARGAALEKKEQRLTKLREAWGRSQEEARKANAATEVQQRIRGVIDRLEKARSQVQKAIKDLLALQNKVGLEDGRAREQLREVMQAQNRAIRKLLQPDAPAVWDPRIMKPDYGQPPPEGGASLATQWAGLGDYLVMHRGSLVVHAVVFAAFVMMLSWMHRHVGQWAAGDDSLRGAAVVLDMPRSTALVLSVMLGAWIYPQPPRLLWPVLGGVALLPSLFILYRLVAGSLRQLLHALAAFYLCGLVLSVLSGYPVGSRLMLLAQLAGGVMFCLWYLRKARRPEEASERLWKVSRLAVRLALAVFSVAIVMNLLGYVGLSRFLNVGLLKSAYLALVLHASLTVVDALVGCFLHFRPVARLRAVQRHRPLLRRRLSRLLRWVAGVWWGLATLDLLSLKRPVLETVAVVLGSGWSLGAAQISLGGVLTFALVVTGAVLLSKFLRFILEEEVYPRVRLARGVPYAISTVLHYVLLLVGFVLAVAALGYDMTKFTILAGAFGVGLGFGMQNIVNNFVSGLILLFERPVQVGDVIQMDTVSGVVTRIGIRASIVKVGDGAEVVVPNGKLIADRFTNWTLSDRKRRLELVVAVVKEADPDKVMECMNRVARAHPLVADSPGPQTCLTEFVAGGMKFELRVWTNRIEDARPLCSELAVGVHKALGDEGVALL